MVLSSLSFWGWEELQEAMHLIVSLWLTTALVAQLSATSLKMHS